MQVIVASLNPVKIEATRLALVEIYPNADIQVHGLAVPSGVAAQPLSCQETYDGARHRALAAKAAIPSADLWVGIEAGIEHRANFAMTFAWIQVLGPKLDNACRSASLTLPPMVANAVAKGEELGDAMDRLFELTNCKQGGGAIGVLTQDRSTRSQVYQSALILALAPYYHAKPYELPAN